MHCEICGKTTGFGKNVAHLRMYVAARAPRKFYPNLQKVRVPDGHGGTRQIVACTRCMRTMRKHGDIQR